MIGFVSAVNRLIPKTNYVVSFNIRYSNSRIPNPLVIVSAVKPLR